MVAMERARSLRKPITETLWENSSFSRGRKRFVCVCVYLYVCLSVLMDSAVAERTKNDDSCGQ